MLLLRHLPWSRGATRCPEVTRELQALRPAGGAGGSGGVSPRSRHPHGRSLRVLRAPHQPGGGMGKGRNPNGRLLSSMASPFLFCWMREITFQAWLCGLRNDNCCPSKKKGCRGCRGRSINPGSRCRQAELLQGATLGPHRAGDRGNWPDIIMHVRPAHI